MWAVCITRPSGCKYLRSIRGYESAGTRRLEAQASRRRPGTAVETLPYAARYWHDTSGSASGASQLPVITIMESNLIESL